MSKLTQKTAPIHKFTYLSVLSVISCLAVVFLHTNGIYWQFAPAEWWVKSNIIETVFYFAVPIFFMISGVTLMDYPKKYSTKTYFKKRFSKTVLPFVFWSLVCGTYDYVREARPFQFNTFLDGIFNTRYVGGIYWYFISLYTIYLVIPILAAIPENKRKRLFEYVIASYVLLNCLLPLAFAYFPLGIKWNGALAMPIGTYYVIFVLLGYYIDRYPLERIWRIGLYILGLLGWAMHYFGTIDLSLKDGAINNLFKGYAGLPTLLYATAIFVFFKYLKPSTLQVLNKWTKWANGQTFGIYLVHYIVYFTIILNMPDLNLKSLWVRLILAPVVFLISFLSVKIMQAIPLLKKMVP